MKKEENGLTFEQNQFISAYVKNKGVVLRACVEAGIGESTYYRWRKDPAFLDELNAAAAQASQLIWDTVVFSFLTVFTKASEMILASAEPPKETNPKSKEKPPKPIRPILTGTEYINLGKELKQIASELKPNTQTERPEANNFLNAVKAITFTFTEPIEESVGEEDPNLEEDIEEDAEDDMGDDTEE